MAKAKTANLSHLHLGALFFMSRGYVIKYNPVSPNGQVKLLPEGNYVDLHKSTFKTLISRGLIEKVSEDALGEKYEITYAGGTFLANKGMF